MFTFNKSKDVHVADDRLWAQLRRAASKEHRLHGAVRHVECLPEGKFRITHEKLGVITRGAIELSAMLAADEAKEPARRAVYNANQRLERIRKSRPDLIKFAEEAVAEYDKSSAERPDLLPPLTPQTRAEALLEVVSEAEAAEAKALEELKQKPRNGFTLRV